MKSLLAVLTLGLFSASAMSADIAAGKAKTVMCQACHGKAGIAAIATYPNLAGQNEAYLVSAIKAYKDKTRTGGQAPVMYGMVAALSDADIKNIAAYYASLK